MKDVLPEYAVIGGEYSGQPCAVARFKGNAGEFCVALDHATVNVNKKAKNATNFEVKRNLLLLLKNGF